MRPRTPEVLLRIDSLRHFLLAEKWKRTRYASARNAPRKIREAEDMLRKIDGIEQWVRQHMTKEEWEKFLA